METFGDFAAGHFIYRLFVVLIGVGVMILGYRMYLHPKAPADAGTVQGEGGGGSIQVRGTAGTFFLVMGALIALAGILGGGSTGKQTETSTQVIHRTDDAGRPVVETVHTTTTREYTDTAMAPQLSLRADPFERFAPRLAGPPRGLALEIRTVGVWRRGGNPGNDSAGQTARRRLSRPNINALIFATRRGILSRSPKWAALCKRFPPKMFPPPPGA